MPFNVSNGSHIISVLCYSAVLCEKMIDQNFLYEVAKRNVYIRDF